MQVIAAKLLFGFVAALLVVFAGRLPKPPLRKRVQLLDGFDQRDTRRGRIRFRRRISALLSWLFIEAPM